MSTRALASTPCSKRMQVPCLLEILCVCGVCVCFLGMTLASVHVTIFAAR